MGDFGVEHDGSIGLNVILFVSFLLCNYLMSRKKISPVPRWPVVLHPAAGRVFVPSLLLLVLLPPSSVFLLPGFDAPSRWSPRNPIKLK